MDAPTPKFHLPLWLQAIVASAGGLGLFLIAFLDSSVLTFPVINDLLLIDLSIRFPARMPYYAAMATIGSVAGVPCAVLRGPQGRGSDVPKKRRPARAKDSQVDQSKRISQHSGRGAFAAADSI